MRNKHKHLKELNLPRLQEKLIYMKYYVIKIQLKELETGNIDEFRPQRRYTNLQTDETQQ